ncbi:hypothetical protein BUQ66_23940 [Vibrio parahaemolyticus]|nr:hypothetical protein BUQ66_23940 [Vibrio parahaemolyticus]
MKSRSLLLLDSYITNCLRVIRNAWHFQFALGLVVKVLCGHFCIACLRPLTRRYAFLRILVEYEIIRFFY